MSTTPPADGTADQPPPSLAEVLSAWTRHMPDVEAPISELAEWFDLKSELLQPITTDPDHPEFDQAREFARVAAQSAQSLRDKETGR